MAELFYINEEGNNVHTAQFLKNRGSCCKTNCLHCPYGTTLKSFGLEFKRVGQNDISRANEIITESLGDQSSIGQSLLNEAFGNNNKNKVTKFNFKDFYFFSLKGTVAGLVKNGRLQLKDLFLRKNFNEQELDLPTVEMYFPKG
ncbi:MAG: hypothetical protein K9K67_12320 [Bacteriovoracaceae bacterium]|nr:hypothetical protein [Bacteriovoracaceae bacterium]